MRRAQCEVKDHTRIAERCCVVEVRPDQITAKSDLGQSSFQRAYRRHIAECLAKRGLPGDLEAIREMEGPGRMKVENRPAQKKSVDSSLRIGGKAASDDL